MSEIQLATIDSMRRVAKEPYIPLWNRFVEQNPTLNDTPASFISRPALRYWQSIGDGPIRKVFSEPGVFNADLFVVSGDSIYRVSSVDGTPAYVGNIGLSSGDVSFAATAPIGVTPANLFFADGGVLWLYREVEGLTQVAMPDDVGAISVATINSYVIVVPVQTEDEDTVGKFYWIDPGEIVVDPLDFATAERSPDKIHQVVVYGDLFWLLGQKTTEPWQTTGDSDAPVLRYQGILFDRGSWEGTAVQVKDSLIVVDEDGGVFQIAGGQQRISTPAVEERIRRAIQRQTQMGV